MSPSTASTVVVVHAHPDDEAIFTGLLLRRLADRGSRVVLVTATGGELGEPCSGGESASSLGAVRLRELERACELLGVARLVLLGQRDSGLPGDAANRHPRALLRCRPDALSATVADLAISEGAAAIVHDDAAGIYGHPDHVTAHRIGSAAAERAGVSGYEVTVDRDLLGGTDHVVTRAVASLGGTSFGAHARDIGLALRGSAREIAGKRAAMAAHASQIDAAELSGPGFDRLYGHEWLTRTRGPAVLEPLATAPQPIASAAVIPQQPGFSRPTPVRSTNSSATSPSTRPTGRPTRRFTHVHP